MSECYSQAELTAPLIADRQTAEDDEILAEIRSLPALADESNPCWNSDEYLKGTAGLFLALADIARQRKLRNTVRPLLERACYGDPGETMRGLRHVFEAIFQPD